MMRAEMPGESNRRPLPKLTEKQAKVRDALKNDLARLAGVIGERNVQHPENYVAARSGFAGSPSMFLHNSLVSIQ